jgi:hypothetical protein
MSTTIQDANYSIVSVKTMSVRASANVCGTVNASRFMTPFGSVDTPVGTVIQSLLTPKQMSRVGKGYVLADGRMVIGTPYNRLTKNTRVPNLMGMFIRGATDTNKIGVHYTDSTAVPNNGFLTTENGEHSHLVFTGDEALRENQQYISIFRNVPNGPDYAKVGHVSASANNALGVTSNAGLHTHFVTGGDAETAPVHVTLNYYVFVGTKPKKKKN